MSEVVVHGENASFLISKPREELAAKLLPSFPREVIAVRMEAKTEDDALSTQRYVDNLALSLGSFAFSRVYKDNDRYGLEVWLQKDVEAALVRALYSSENAAHK